MKKKEKGLSGLENDKDKWLMKKKVGIKWESDSFRLKKEYLDTRKSIAVDEVKLLILPDTDTTNDKIRFILIT